jgi:hypothetical protein
MTGDSLPRRRAFVLQIDARFEAEDGTLCGRIEHVASGQAIRFGSTAELLAFLMRTLAGQPADTPTG